MTEGRALAVWVAAAVLALAAGTAVFFALRKPTLPPPKPVETVVRTAEAIIRTLRGGRTPLRVWRFDTRKVTCGEFRRLLEREVANPDATLWMPGEHDWIVVQRKTDARASLAVMMEAFGEKDFYDSLPGLFASYVGEIREVMPAFGALRPDDLVVPELFVSREVPAIGWIDASDVDEDIRKEALAEIRSAQVVRRVVLEGDIASRKGKEDEAVAAWARAHLRNPRDPLLVERLEKLEINAMTFLKVGNFAGAEKCYETMLGIRPDDAQTAYALGSCLRQLGREDLANRVFEKAKAIDGAASRAAAKGVRGRGGKDGKTE